MAKTLECAITQLAETYIHCALFGTERRLTVGRDQLLSDGRTRKRLWQELGSGGFITPDAKDATIGQITNVAFHHVLAQCHELDLASMYTFDAHSDNQSEGAAFVVWDRLKLPQKAFVVDQLRRDPSRFTLLAYDRYRTNNTHTAPLGELGQAHEAVGGYQIAILAVTDAAVQAKRDEAARVHYKAECEAVGLNWFLHKTGAFQPEEELPIMEKTPMFGGGIPRKPSEWPSDVPAQVQATKDKIVKLRQRLALLEKLQAYVERIGGWPVFLADYDSSINAYVREQVEAGKLSKGVTR